MTGIDLFMGFQGQNLACLKNNGCARKTNKKQNFIFYMNLNFIQLI